MAVNALVPAGVVVAGGLILWTGWQWLNPAASIVISAVIVAGTWSLLCDAVNLLLAAVLNAINRETIGACPRGQRGVIEVHKAHSWRMSTTETALTAHLVQTGAALDAGLVQRACTEVGSLGLGHATFQVDTVEMAHACALRSDAVV